MNVAEKDLAARHSEAAAIEDMHDVFNRQRQAFLRDGMPTYDERIANINRVLKTMLANKDRIVYAICSDFGDHSRHEAFLAEIFTTLAGIKYTKKNLKQWMRPRKRHVDLTFQPAKAKVIYQPKGVVGIISPWNYPFYLAAAPLVTALAAGNRVMLKPSEITPKTADLMKELFGSVFDAELVHVCVGGPAVGDAFSRLPWDHLFFTGSTALGKVIMKNAAENLTPVTLELGGKSPLILHRDYPIERAVKRIVSGKCLNGAQTCVAPDYLLVPEEQVEPLIGALKSEFGKCYPTVYNNPDYTGVVNERHFSRLQGYLEDAKQKGAEIIEINPANETRPNGNRKIPPTIVLKTNDDMKIMQDEIFGPLLPIVPYKTLDEAIKFVNDRPRPLALYYFDDDEHRANKVLERTISGNACINETVMHVGVDDLPFGGIGASGIGGYHGKEGFETFSHKKGILLKGKFNSANLLAPPFDKKIERILNLMLK